MLWIAKAKDPFTGEIFDWKIDAPGYFEAKDKFSDIMSTRNPFFAAAAETWIEPADEQPADVKCYMITGANQHGHQTNYADTWAEACECSDLMADFYEFVEIAYGWPGHWKPIDEIEEDSRDVGKRLAASYYKEAEQ